MTKRQVIQKLTKTVRETARIGQKAVAWDVACAGTCGEGEHVHRVNRILRTQAFACNCPAGRYDRLCIHVQAVVKAEFGDLGYQASAWKTQAEADKQRRHAYTIALADGTRVWITARKTKRALFTL